MLIAIIDPNRAVEDKYIDFAAATVDGKRHRGVITAETGVSVTLQGAENKQTVILRRDLEEFISTGKSLMPEGVEKDIPPGDMADLIAFVRQLGPPPKKFPRNKPVVLKPNDQGDFRLVATTCKIYGPTLVLEQKYLNLGYWQNAQDRAVWTIAAPTAGKYRVQMNYACHNNSAGDTMLLEIQGRSITHRVEGGGDWDNYHEKTIGEIELPAGEVEIIVRCAKPPKSAMIDLRWITLTRMESNGQR